MSDLKLETEGGRWWVADPERRLKPSAARLNVMDVVYSDSKGSWILRNATPAIREQVQVLVDAANRGTPVADDPAPRPASQHVELVESNGRLYVSGPRHVMMDSVNPRLKGLGFRWESPFWVLNAGAITPRQRANLEKLIAPFGAGGGADLRSPAKKKEDELERRKREGLGVSVAFSLNTLIKQLGGVFDERSGKWYLPDAAAVKEVLEADAATPERKAQRELARRKQEGLSVNLPFEWNDEIKRHGGIWDKESRRWYLPDAAAVKEITDKYNQAREVARRHEQEKAETARAERDREMTEKGLRYLYVPGEYKGSHPAVGSTFRDRKRNELVTVVEVKSTFYPEDGMSFGLPFDRGYMHRLTVRAADTAERAPHEEAEARELRRDEASRVRRELVRHFMDRGSRPAGPVDLRSSDRLALEGRDSLAYGGGSWFVVEGGSLWYVQNNGADGDAWDRNNVTTGGAGAIGWRLPGDPELEAKIRAVDAAL